MFKIDILDLYATEQVANSVRYKLTINDGKNQVETENNYVFPEGIVKKPLELIVESDLIQWIEQSDLSDIKSNLEKQLSALKSVEKVDFPWLAGTFTIE